VRDFQAFARQTGNDLIDQQAREVDGKEEYTHLLRRR
jgi:tRNA 2-thiouridine synthesizing protein A